MSPTQVIAILGKPSRRSKTELAYFLHVMKKLSAQERADLHRAQPLLTDADLDNGYDWNAFISAKFTNGRLSFSVHLHLRNQMTVGR